MKSALEKEWKELQCLIYSARWGKGEDNDELYERIMEYNKQRLTDQKRKMIKKIKKFKRNATINGEPYFTIMISDKEWNTLLKEFDEVTK